jgi:hypothetical protein
MRARTLQLHSGFRKQILQPILRSCEEHHRYCLRLRTFRLHRQSPERVGRLLGMRILTLTFL